MAGLRGQAPLVAFMFFRVAAPPLVFVVALFYLFVVAELGYPPLMKVAIAFAAGGAGYYLPNVFIENLTQKRRQSIQTSFPEALDMLLICVQSGMSVEAAFGKVSREIANQSVELGEEMSLTTAELSYLPDRRQAFENLAKRTGLPGVKAVTTALDPGRALRHASGAGAAHHGEGEPRHAHVGSRAQGRVAAAEAHGPHDHFLPAGAVSGHSRTGGHQLLEDAVACYCEGAERHCVLGVSGKAMLRSRTEDRPHACENAGTGAIAAG